MTTSDVPDFIVKLTFDCLVGNNELYKQVKNHLESKGYDIVNPPGPVKDGDEYLKGGLKWVRTTPGLYPDDMLKISNYIVRRPTEHLKMVHFFFPRRSM